MKPLILITNDDGVSSRGLLHLVEVAQEYGDIVVMAPDHNASGLSTSITTARPLRIREVSQSDGVAVYSCDGTPADCVKMGLEHFCPRKPDLVLSGINYGSNASINIIYSGTMGAALEACLNGCQAIGFSLLNHNPAADYLLGFQYVLHGQQEEFLARDQLVGTIVEVLAHLANEVDCCTKLVFTLEAGDFLAKRFASDAIEV